METYLHGLFAFNLFNMATQKNTSATPIINLTPTESESSTPIESGRPGAVHAPKIVRAPTPETGVAVSSTSSKIATRNAAVKKLKLNVPQARALARETIALIQAEIATAKAELGSDLEYLKALQEFQKNNDLYKEFDYFAKQLATINFNRVNSLIHAFNKERITDERGYSINHVDTYNSLDPQGRMQNMVEDFKRKFFRTRMAALTNISLSEDGVFDRILVMTIDFKADTTIRDFQREVIGALNPNLLVLIPNLQALAESEPAA